MSVTDRKLVDSHLHMTGERCLAAIEQRDRCSLCEKRAIMTALATDNTSPWRELIAEHARIQVCAEARKIEGIDHTFSRHATFPSHGDTPLDEIDLRG